MRAVVITGASTGIGRACALTLDRKGFHVFAGVRREQDATSLRSAATDRLTPVHLDVTDEQSIMDASHAVADAVGETGLAGLVNNAGTTLPCPVEYLDLADFRHQIEVNLTGHLAMTKVFLPMLRSARGRIVNVSSVSGKIGGPMMAPYSAAKHGIEGLSDSLRLELAGSGIRVSIIEPGLISTAMKDKLERDTEATLRSLPDEGRSRYGAALRTLASTISREAAHGSAPDAVAEAVVHALTSPRPRIRYPAGARAKRLLLLRRILPDAWMDRVLLHAVGLKPR